MSHLLRTYRHEAVLYEGLDGFLYVAEPFIREGVETGEPVLVVVSADKIRRLTEVLGRIADRVEFADMDDVGSNPARIIPFWHDFIERSAGRSIRGIGEPVHELRSPVDLVECVQHEALLNVAVDHATPLWLMCPYDTASLGREALQCALRTHPVIVEGGVSSPSTQYDHPAIVEMALALPLTASPPGAVAVDLLVDSVEPAREFLLAAAERSELGPARSAALLIAVREAILAAGRGSQVRVCVWHEGGRFVCEVADSAKLVDPLAGRRRPTEAVHDRPGLWLANELCDLVQVRSSDDGTVVRMHVDLPAAPPHASPVSS